MAKKKAVKVRKWITCAEPGCKRRSLVKGAYCKEHLEKFKKRVAAAAEKRKGKLATRATRAEYLKRKEKEEKKKQKQTEKYSRAVDEARASVDADTKKRKAKIASSGLIKDPGSRLLKAYCEKCSYTIRLSRKWIEVRRPICPVCMKNMVTELGGESGADPRQLPLKPIKKRGMIKERGV